jgi:hypothetical protein
MTPSPPAGTPQQPGFMQRMGQGYLQGVARQSPLGNAVYNAFADPAQPGAGPYARYQSGGGMGQNPMPGPPPALTGPASVAGAGEGVAGAAAGAGDAAGGMGIGADLLAGGSVITEPTLARIGERGPEAVVPLTPRPSNKMQPDLLEAHGTAPKVPGVKYSRYKSFNRFGGGGM